MGSLSLSAALALAQACAPQVAPSTLVSVAEAESALNPWVIGINGPRHRALHAASAREAEGLATDLAAEGADFDLGLTQINVRNLPRLRMTLGDAFDPCRNFQGAARILTGAYRRASRAGVAAQTALPVALSLYNTGDPKRGFRNGYVARVYRVAAQVVPAIGSEASPPADALSPAATVAAMPEEAIAAPVSTAAATPPPLDVFAREAAPSLVWNAATPPSPPPLPLRRERLTSPGAPQ